MTKTNKTTPSTQLNHKNLDKLTLVDTLEDLLDTVQELAIILSCTEDKPSANTISRLLQCIVDSTKFTIHKEGGYSNE